MKPFFIEIQSFWARADKLGRYILGHFRHFWANYQHPFWCSESLAHYFYKKLGLYIYIPNIYFGSGFEFGPQRIRDLAFVCP